MKSYIDSETGQAWRFDDNVLVSYDDNKYVFTAPHGEQLNVPVTLVPAPDGWEPPAPEQGIPQSVTPAQGLMALYTLKQITEDDILAAIASIGDATLRYQAQIAYKKATSWDRPSITMQTVAQLMALTESDLDDLFALAPTYTNL